MYNVYFASWLFVLLLWGRYYYRDLEMYLVSIMYRLMNLFSKKFLTMKLSYGSMPQRSGVVFF